MSFLQPMLLAALPLPDMTPDHARDLVVMHLVNRARSTSSRLNNQQKPHDSS